VPDSEFQRAADDYLAECRTKREPPRATELAERLQMPISKFTRFFNAVVGVPPGTYLKQMHVYQAIDVIRNTDLDYGAIADIVGFGSRTTLFRAIRRITGKTPDFFRKSKTTIKPKNKKRRRNARKERG
jgi:AraC-like DNA-binding protein